MSEYIPAKYITYQDALEHLGFTKVQVNTISEIEKQRYQNWTREANNLVESKLSQFGNTTPLAATSNEYTYAKSAALNWVVYKKRDKEGSQNARNAKEDHRHDLDELVKFLTGLRTDRTKTVSIVGTRAGGNKILLPSQIDTQFYD